MKYSLFDRMAEMTQAEVERLLPLVSDERREQALRFRHLQGQYCCLKSYVMLSELLGYAPSFTYNEHGKPLLADGQYCSISHCRNGILVAIDDQPIGVDIESIREAKESLVAYTMSETEQAQIMQSDSPDEMFTRLWTRKEALLKAEGTGITDAIRTVLDAAYGWQLDSVLCRERGYIYSICRRVR